MALSFRTLLGCALFLPFSLYGENLLRNADLREPSSGASLPDEWELATSFTGERVEEGGEMMLRLYAEEDDTNATWVQHRLPMTPGGRYRVRFRAKAEPGVRYRVYVESWDEGRENAFPQGAHWREGKGDWEEGSFEVTYEAERTPPYLALHVEAPGEIFFAGLELTDLDAAPAPPEGGELAVGLEAWKLPPQAKIAKSFEGEFFEITAPKGQNPTLWIPHLGAQPGQRYRLSYQVKAGVGAQTDTGFVFFRLFTMKAAEKPGTPLAGGEWQDCFEAWQTRHLEFDGDQLGLVLEFKGPGTLFARNFSIEAIEPERQAAFEAHLTRPAYRGMLIGEEREIAGVLTAKQEGISTFALRLVQGGKELAKKEVSAGSFALEAAGLGEGSATLEIIASGVKGEVERQALELLRVPPSEPSVLVGEDLVLRRDGKPFFTIGLWAVPSNHRQLHELNAAGFNTFVAPMRKALLDQAARYNLAVIGDLESPALVAKTSDPAQLATLEKRLTGTVERYRRHPALLAYYIADEPLWTGRPLPHLRWTYEQVLRADPYHPIWINEAPRNTVENLAKYATAADLFGVDIYPVPNGGTHSDLEDRTLSSVGAYTRRFHETVAHRKPIWMVLQGFAWLNLHDRTADGIYPTAEESRFMAYNAIVHGAHGIIYWGTPFINEPKFWEGLFQTTSQLRDLSAVLVEPTVKEPALTTTTPGIAILHKRHAGADYYLVINEREEGQKAALSLAGGAQKLHVHFEGRSIEVKEGRFEDDFAGWGVHVYSTSDTLPPPLVPEAQGVPTDGESFLEQARRRKVHHAFETKANWIWSETMAPGAVAAFRHRFQVGAGVRKATLWITGDDAYEVWLDGKRIGADLGQGPEEEELGGWENIEGYDVTAALSAGEHLLAVRAEDSGKLPCGLLVDLRLEYSDGRTEHQLSGEQWLVHTQPAKGWQQPGPDGEGWQQARVITPYGSGPWRNALEVNLIR